MVQKRKTLIWKCAQWQFWPNGLSLFSSFTWFSMICVMGKHQSVVYYRSRVVALGSEINKHSERPSRNFYDFHFKQWHCYCIFTPIWIVETCDGHLHFIFQNYCIWRVLTQTGMRKSALYAVFSSLPLNGFFCPTALCGDGLGLPIFFHTSC